VLHSVFLDLVDEERFFRCLEFCYRTIWNRFGLLLAAEFKLDWAARKLVHFSELVDEILLIRVCHQCWVIEEDDEFWRSALDLSHVVNAETLADDERRMVLLQAHLDESVELACGDFAEPFSINFIDEWEDFIEVAPFNCGEEKGRAMG